MKTSHTATGKTDCGEETKNQEYYEETPSTKVKDVLKFIGVVREVEKFDEDKGEGRGDTIKVEQCSTKDDYTTTEMNRTRNRERSSRKRRWDVRE